MGLIEDYQGLCEGIFAGVIGAHVGLYRDCRGMEEQMETTLGRTRLYVDSHSPTCTTLGSDISAPSR